MQSAKDEKNAAMKSGQDDPNAALKIQIANTKERLAALQMRLAAAEQRS